MAQEHIKVGADASGMRLDIFLKERLPDCSRKTAKRLLDAGLVRVNSRKIIIASWGLKAGDEVSIADAPGLDIDVSKSFLKVIYEDDYLLVIDKDAGISCETSPLSLKPSLVQIINSYLLTNSPEESRPYVGLIHRLDTETSGLMVYTKKKAANKISEQFKSHSVQRHYQTVVSGRVERENGVIKTFIEKFDDVGGTKVRATLRGRGRKAETLYRVIERYSDATFLDIIPKTGRTHQIRVHMAHIGHPVWADKLYGSEEKKYSQYIRRQALHASVLGFKHPISGKKIKFTSELPRDMRRLIDRLRLKG
jgi:23S rRNA pseudouridine1911/1915/1917 synthase